MACWFSVVSAGNYWLGQSICYWIWVDYCENDDRKFTTPPRDTINIGKDMLGNVEANATLEQQNWINWGRKLPYVQLFHFQQQNKTTWAQFLPSSRGVNVQL